MSDDREVKQLNPAPASSDDGRPRTFSEFTAYANIVLLGDPGAGKTHLFRSFSSSAAARFLTVRQYLNSPPTAAAETLFIDALDERRSGRGDDDVVDRIVQKLHSKPPERLRISCRQRDWLAESDLAAFQPYFDDHGGVVVLALEALTRREQLLILQAERIADPEEFINQTEKRGLQEFLRNPQNLIMLAQVVRSGSWPNTRSELFDISTRLLLREHNRERARKGAGVFHEDRLRLTAGAIFALRLISDVDGVSLEEYTTDENYPSCRTIPFLEPNLAAAALGRRIFTAAGQHDALDYTHRTTAEYLAAIWLADQIRKGLPIERVRSIISVESIPSSELRGLHAWLPLMLPEYAELFVNADPYGVLTYGDVASLTPTTRIHVLQALSELSEVDPGFRRADLSSSRLGGLSGPEMLDAFRNILRSPNANFSMRTIVLDAVAEGTPLPALKEDLVSILLNDAAPFAERDKSLAALLHLGEEGDATIYEVYRTTLRKDGSSLRLRVSILSELYPGPFYPSDIQELIYDTLKSESELPAGEFWWLPPMIPVGHIAAILNSLELDSIITDVGRAERRNLYDVGHFIDRLLVRALNERDDIQPDELFKWLSLRRHFRGSYHSAEDLKTALQHQRPIVLGIIDVAIQNLPSDERSWRYLDRLQEITLFVVTSDDLLSKLTRYLDDSMEVGEKELLVYEQAITLCYRTPTVARPFFDRLYTLADERASLATLRDRGTACEVQEWRVKQAQKKADQQVAHEAAMARNLDEFDVHRRAIEEGAHLGWLGYLARIYFGLFSDTDKRVKPVVRLTETIGEARTTAALRGFKAITQSSQVPAVGEIAAENIQHRRWDWWYAIIAGLEERWSDEGSIEQWSDELVASGLAIELLHTIYQSDGNNTMRPIRHEWKARTLRDRSQLAHRTYVTIAETALAHDEQYIPGLRELLDQENLATFRTETVLYFLRKYPNAKTHYLDDLLKAACGSKRARGELVSLAGDLLKREGLSADNYRKWLTIAYLIAPVEFQGKLSREQDDVEIVWLIRDRMQELSGERSHIRLTPAQLLFLAELATKHFPTREGYPSNGWSGDRNPWDGTEFVLILINRLSADPSQAATDCLVALDTNERLVAYGDNIKHALANQLRRRRDAEFRQPSWYQAISTLSNREPANVSDLHALLVGTLKDLTVQFRGANNDVYKRFWNEDQYGRPTHPKPEESCRDVLLDFLRTRLTPLRITAEPEGHMVRDKRADISVQYPAQKVPIELKRDYHGDVWHAAGTQLDRLYSLDPDASGFGIYGVFWFGKRRPVSIPTHPNGAPSPQSSQEMESMLSDLISPEQRSRLAVIVLDVSGDVDG